jgi:hypothetical protein
MGAVPTKEEIERRKKIEEYWHKTAKGKSLRRSQDDRIIRSFFNDYASGKEYLEREEALAYINDLLKISGFDKEIFKEAKAAHASSKQRYEDYVLAIFNEMDPDMTGRITYAQLIKPKFKEWNDFLQVISQRGSRDREIIRRLRKREVRHAVKEDNASSDEELQEQEIQAVDDMWSQQVEEEMAAEADQEETALDNAKLCKMREEQIKEVCEILQIDVQTAQSLLTYTQWDNDRLFTEYFADREKLFTSAHLQVPPEPTESNSNTSESTNSNETDKPKALECSICFEEVGEGQFTGLDACRHYFCNDCWKTNLTDVQIKEGHTLDITCMHMNCKSLVPADVVQKLVDAPVFQKYASFLSKSFVDSNSELRWCTEPGCDKAVFNPVSEGCCLIGKCSCGNRFCWACMQEAHPTITCDTMKNWITLVAQNATMLKAGGGNQTADAKTLNWILMNTKDCPNCGVSVQKNQGCFAMTCSNCSSQWCWLCLQDWSTHSNHFKCAKYKGFKPDDNARFVMGDMKKRKRRYKMAYFYNMYKQQDDSMKTFASKRDNLRVLGVQLMSSISEDFDTSFIEEALNELKDCRLALKYSFVWAFYQRKKHKRTVYEFLQGNLDMVVVKLLTGLEQPLGQFSPSEIRKLIKVAEKTRLHLLEFK